MVNGHLALEPLTGTTRFLVTANSRRVPTAHCYRSLTDDLANRPDSVSGQIDNLHEIVPR
jgi:hypothetical protein